MDGTVTALLNGYIMPVDVEQALTYLTNLEDVFGKLYLYQKFFPDEYAQSTGYNFPRQNQTYSEKEIEFFRLVNDKLFPVNWEEYQYQNQDGDERDDTIWLESLAPDGWWECEISEWQPGWQVVISMVAGQDGWQAEMELGTPELNAVIRKLNFKDRLNWPKLEGRMRDAPAPFRYWLTALAATDHSTGNPFFDYSYESPCYEYSWNDSDVAALAEFYHEALEMEVNIKSFMSWMLGDVANLKEVVSLWNECVE